MELEHLPDFLIELKQNPDQMFGELFDARTVFENIVDEFFIMQLEKLEMCMNFLLVERKNEDDEFLLVEGKKQKNFFLPLLLILLF